MNDIINTGNIIPQEKPETTTPGVKTTSFLSNLISKVPPPIKVALNKFYSNKKIFWPVTIAFGLLFLVLIAGILFGSKTVGPPKKLATPTPVVSVIQPTPGSDPLSQIGARLSLLKDNISNFDIKQSKLKPPTIDFDIKF